MVVLLRKVGHLPIDAGQFLPSVIPSPAFVAPFLRFRLIFCRINKRSELRHGHLVLPHVERLGDGDLVL